MAAKAQRTALPQVICPIQISIDGKITIDHWPDPDAAAEFDCPTVHFPPGLSHGCEVFAER
jgi:hypothetical protein